MDTLRAIDGLNQYGDFSSGKSQERQDNARINEYYLNLAEQLFPTFSVMCSMNQGHPLINFRGTLLKEYGYTEDEYRAFYRAGFVGLVYEKDIAKPCALNVLSMERDQRETEYRVIKKDGTLAWVLEHGMITHGEDGEPAYLCVMIDITKRKKAEEARRTSNEETRLALAQSGRSVFRYTFADKTLCFDEYTAALHGLPPVIQHPHKWAVETGIILPDSIADYDDLFVLPKQNELGKTKYLHLLLNDKTIWCEVKYSVFKDDEGAPLVAIVSCLDVTERHERELAYECYCRSIAKAAQQDACSFESDLTRNKIEKQSGILRDVVARDFVGMSYMETVQNVAACFTRSSEREKLIAAFSREHLLTLFADGSNETALECCGPRQGGRILWLAASMQMVADPYTGDVKAYTLIKDVTREKTEGQELVRRAEHDGLTDLYNKTTTQERIAKALETRTDEDCVLMIIDIDDLKSVNDQHGHAEGDRVISRVAGTIRAHFRRTDIVGRVGGDEFMVFLMGKFSHIKLRAIVMAMMRDLHSIHAGEKAILPVRVSIGLTLSENGRPVVFDSLYRQADTALYQVKRSGKGNYAFYEPQMELAAYRCAGGGGLSLLHTEIASEDARHLLEAVSRAFPLVVSVNLSQNHYYMLEYDRYAAMACDEEGAFDQLIKDALETIHEKDRRAFRDAFSRENLLKAFATGASTVCLECAQRGNNGVFRGVQIIVAFVHDNTNDICQITLGRVLDDHT